MEYIRITLENEYLNDNIELDLFRFKDKDNIRFSAVHDSLERIQREKLNNVDFELTVHTANEKYAAVQVTLRDSYGRCVSEVADVNTYHLMATDNKEYYKAHPLVAAKNNAFDAAVRKFIGLPRTFEPDTCPELAAYLEEHPEALLSDEDVIAETEPEKISDEVQADKVDSDPVKNEEKKENPYSNEIFGGGKYAGMTYGDVYQTDPNYFKRASKWKGYEKVNDFLKAEEE